MKKDNSLNKSVKLRVGVDVSMLSERTTGIGRYAYEILKRLVLIEHEWFFYSHRPLIIGNWTQENVHKCTGKVHKRGLRLLWMQTVVPVMAVRDKVNVFWSPAHRLPRLLPSRVAKVVTIHDLVWRMAGETMRPATRWLDSTLMPHAVRKADRIIAVSENTARDVLTEMPYSNGKICIIPLGATNLATTKKVEVCNAISLDEPYFLFVGTLEPRKNLIGLIEAYSRLSLELRSRAMLVIAGGEGWGGFDVSAAVRKFGVQDRVKVLGYVSDIQLNTLYKHSLFLAMPSFYEGFGLPLLEAMSHGTPVITSNRGSMPEVVGDAGLLVDPYSINSIKEALKALLSDQTLVSNLRLKAIIKSKHFCWDRAARQTLKVIEDAASM